MDPDYALTQLHTSTELGFEPHQALEKVCQDAMEQNVKYPKVSKREKRKADCLDEAPIVSSSSSTVTDYYNTTGRPYPDNAYIRAAAKVLKLEFPAIRRTERLVRECRGLYAPARRNLLIRAEAWQADVMPAERPAKKRRPSQDLVAFSLRRFPPETAVLGKVRVTNDIPDQLRTEVEWVLGGGQGPAEQKREQKEEPKAGSSGIECGCCFDDSTPFENLVQCNEGHLICQDCARSYANQQIGMRLVDLCCIHTDGCEVTFAEGEIMRFLLPKTYTLLHRIRQEIEVEKAGIEGLEGCPFCSFACVIDNPEKLFACQSEDCGVVSCRFCRLVEHLPLSCEEVKQQNDDRRKHEMEDKLSEALIRRCPTQGCGTPLIKSDGCNKMRCSKCQNLMCYVCKQHIPNNVGYKHFDEARGRPASASTRVKCPLWDDTAARHDPYSL